MKSIRQARASRDGGSHSPPVGWHGGTNFKENFRQETRLLRHILLILECEREKHL